MSRPPADSPRKRRGAGRITLSAVAERIGVSSITVSRYFNQPNQVSQELRERIRSAVEEMGYVPNLAAGGLLAGRRAGVRIPEDCAVVGFGDYAFAPMLMPSLTTIRPPARQIGEVAAQRILQKLGILPEAPSDAPAPLQCELIERESS